MTRLGRTIPALPVAAIQPSVDFYCDRLGFAEIYADEGYGIVRRDEAEIHLWAATDEAWRNRFDPAKPVDSGAESFLAGTAGCRVDVEGVDELYAHCRGTGIVHPKGALAATPWGTREFAVTDVDNNLITFFERTT